MMAVQMVHGLPVVLKNQNVGYLSLIFFLWRTTPMVYCGCKIILRAPRIRFTRKHELAPHYRAVEG